MYSYEHGDGVGSALDLILQGFIHAIATAAVPVVMCAGVLYLLVSGQEFVLPPAGSGLFPEEKSSECIRP